MICSRLEWDSDFFEIEITEIDYTKVKETKFLDLGNFELIYLKNCSSESFSIPKFKLKFQETKVVFSKNIQSKNTKLGYVISDTDSSILDYKALYPLAFESGKHSRFKLDPNFQEMKFRELYIKWVDNSINKQIADKVLYIKKEKDVVGFVTVKKHYDHAKIGLIAVDPKNQGNGYGRGLIEAVENYCIENKLFELRIPTQKGNLSACQFYTKLGYSNIKQTNIKHFWRV